MSELSVEIARYSAQRLVAYFNVSSSVIFLWEHCITFDQELIAIWTARWTVGKCLYILMKYSAFVQVGIVLWTQVVPSEWERACKISFITVAWLLVFGLGVGELLLSIRTWAVWKTPRLMGILLGAFWVVAWGAICAILVIFLRTVEFKADPNAPFPGCFLHEANPIFFLDFIILLLYDTVMLVLILIPAYKSYKAGGTSQFVRSVYRDGIVYYVYLFALSLLNIILVLKLSLDLAILLTQMERVLHSVLTGRVILNIHAESRARQNPSLFSSHAGYTTDEGPVILVALGSKDRGHERSSSWSPENAATPSTASKGSLECKICNRTSCVSVFAFVLLSYSHSRHHQQELWIIVDSVQTYHIIQTSTS
ncbi:hypothetical protein BKA70DRAFT_1152199 [Coprinopsis sp. MPI-PUGE-AT-0042]|nr:hypothetical protein BKA70DRAFT_1152199 [Coprinopsis sp. MPI-PUGE-AT-0042]